MGLLDWLRGKRAGASPAPAPLPIPLPNKEAAPPRPRIQVVPPLSGAPAAAPSQPGPAPDPDTWEEPADATPDRDDGDDGDQATTDRRRSASEAALATTPTTPYAAPLLASDCPGVSLPREGYARQHSARPGASWAIDLAVVVGTPVRAPCDGVVSRVSDADTDTYGNGNGVWIRPDAGPITSIAAIHLRGVEVSLGQRVERGQVIGRSGNTGASTGPHLHWEIAPALDPLDPALVDWRGAGWAL